MQEARRLYGERSDLALMDSKEAALDTAHALVILTEWLNFRVVDFALVRERLGDKVIFDGRNLFDPAHLTREGLAYYPIGRAAVGVAQP
ncbi:UDP-glucose/GDP-mannose dehydrogenase family, UDP binding domain [compost metagenome]